jgi:exodeoxyribonuclease-3
MKIATFNANSVRSRLDIILAWLARQEPDILCVQETKVQDADFPADAFTQAGYHVAFRGQKAYNGVAVVSREVPKTVAFGLDDEPLDETRVLYARFGSIHVINTYVPQGREITHAMYPYKLEWLARLRHYFNSHFSPRMKVIWLGDMNVAPQAIDVHNPEQQSKHVCFHQEVRQAFENVVEWGFVDVFRQHHPEPGHFSFFDYRVPNACKRGMGWRVDHIMATPSLARRCLDCRIDLAPRLEPKPSDHTFVVAEFAE